MKVFKKRHLQLIIATASTMLFSNVIIVACSASLSHEINSLYNSCAHGRAHRIEFLLTNNPDLIKKSHGQRQERALQIAAKNGHLETAKVLIQYGADVNEVHPRELVSPLGWASRGGYNELVSLLLEKGADPDWTSAISLQSNPLVLLCQAYCNQINRHRVEGVGKVFDENQLEQREDIARQLLAHGANINAFVSGFTPLMYLVGKIHCSSKTAVGVGRMVTLLLKNGADSNIQSMIDKKTALDYAIENGHADAVKSLCQHKALQLRDSVSRGDIAPLQEWGESDQFHTDVVTAQIDNGKTLLHIACKKGDHPIASLLLEKSAQIHVCDDGGNTPLHLACSNGATSAELVALLLQHNALINAINKKKRTALMNAVRAKNVTATQVLLEAGADVNVIDAQEDRALHIAARQDNAEIAQLLVEANASCTQRNGRGRLPFELAQEDGCQEVATVLRGGYVSEVLVVIPDLVPSQQEGRELSDDQDDLGCVLVLHHDDIDIVSEDEDQ